MKSRLPREINADERAILDTIRSCAAKGLPARIFNSAARTRLQRLGYIEAKSVGKCSRAGAALMSYSLTPSGEKI